MLTKIELNQKKAKSSEQLDLVETISSVDKVQQKRRLVIIAIIATVGLSLIFWLFHTFRSFDFSIPKIPKFSSVPTKSEDVSVQINKITGKNSHLWEVNTNLTPSDSETSILTISPNSLIKDSLPEGLEIKENLQLGATSQSFSTLITVPQKNIYINLKYSSTGQEEFKSTVKKIIPLIYWSTIQSVSN